MSIDVMLCFMFCDTVTKNLPAQFHSHKRARTNRKANWLPTNISLHWRTQPQKLGKAHSVISWTLFTTGSKSQLFVHILLGVGKFVIHLYVLKFYDNMETKATSLPIMRF